MNLPAIIKQLFGRLSGLFSLYEFGAVLDGATDDLPAINRALDYVGAQPGTLLVAGQCYVSANVTIPASLKVRFEANGGFVGPGVVTFTRWESVLVILTSQLSGLITTAMIAANAVTAAKMSLSAKASLITASAGGSASELAVGVDGQVLTADSTQALGLKWAAGGGGGGVVFLFKWAREASSVPSVGTWAAIVEAGITGATQVQSAANGNHFEINQTNGDASWARSNRMVSGALSKADYTVRCLIRPVVTGFYRYVLGARCDQGNPTNGYFLTMYQDATTFNVGLYKSVAGVQTTLVAAVAFNTLFPGFTASQAQEPFMAELVVKGPIIVARLQGRTIFFVYDAAIAGPGAASVGTTPAGNSTATLLSFDELTVLDSTAYFVGG